MLRRSARKRTNEPAAILTVSEGNPLFEIRKRRRLAVGGAADAGHVWVVTHFTPREQAAGVRVFSSEV